MEQHLLSLKSLVERAKRSMDEEAWAQALDLLAQADALAREHGLNRAWLNWARAVCADVTGHHLEAFDFIEHALSLDPSNAQAWLSHKIIVDRIRDLVIEPGTVLEIRSAAYDKLTAKGLAGYDVNVARIDILRAQGRSGDAFIFAMTLASIWPTEDLARLIEQLRPEVQ